MKVLKLSIIFILISQSIGQDCDGEYSMTDDCGTCHDAYCYDYVSHVTNTDFPCDGPTEMFVSADSDYNSDWNLTCDTDLIYSSFTWDYFTDNSGGSNFPNSCDSENCDVVDLITLTGGMITSSGNLYGISNPLVININSDYTLIETIDLTITTLGTELDYSFTSLNIGTEFIYPSYEILSHEADNWGGASVTVKYSWQNLLNSFENNNWTIEFSALGSHMSLDQVILELNSNYYNDCQSVAASGDTNNDGYTNVNDIVTIIDSIISLNDLNECAISASDINLDGEVNVLDVISIVEFILYGDLARSTMQIPNKINLFKDQNKLLYESDVDGLIGFELTVKHDLGCNFILNQDAFISDYNTNENITKMVVIIESGNYIFEASTDFEIIKLLVGSLNGEIKSDISILPNKLSLGKAYPNPFNPNTSFEFIMPENGHVSIKVYNLVGQIIDIIHEGYLENSSYTFSWDATAFPSGMYILQAEYKNQIDVQKITLVK